jgi:hypothetical protein
VGVYKKAYNEWKRYYYLTDGRGRFLAFTDSAGYEKVLSPVFWT